MGINIINVASQVVANIRIDVCRLSALQNADLEHRASSIDHSSRLYRQIVTVLTHLNFKGSAMLYAVIGTFLGALAMVCLYCSWRGASKAWLTAAGWLLTLLSLWSWILASGAEFGVTLTLLVVPLIAWLIILFNTDVRQQRPQNQNQGALVAPRMQTLLYHCWLFVLAVPLAGAAAVFTTTAFTLALPVAKVNAVITAVILIPIVWGLASYWVCAARKPHHPAIWLLALTGGCAGLIYL